MMIFSRYMTRKGTTGSYGSSILVFKGICIQFSIVAIPIYISNNSVEGLIVALYKIQKQPKCSSTEEWVNKMWYIHMMEYYSAIKGTK